MRVGDYIRRFKTDNCFKVTDKISDGFIVNEFDEETGHAYGNDEFKHYINVLDCKKYVEFEFIPKRPEQPLIKQETVKYVRELISILIQYDFLDIEPNMFNDFEVQANAINHLLFEIKSDEHIGKWVERKATDLYPADFAEDLVHSNFPEIIEFIKDIRTPTLNFISSIEKLNKEKGS